jgi:hypothetical protein
LRRSPCGSADQGYSNQQGHGRMRDAKRGRFGDSGFSIDFQRTILIGLAPFIAVSAKEGIVFP